MTKTDWRFDPLPPSGAKTGGLTSAHVLPASLDTFVREVLQNAQDQKRSDSCATDVRFTVSRYNSGMVDDILEAISWCTLKTHLQGAAHRGGVTIGPQLRAGLESLSSGSLTILRIEDRGTYGLTGDEDDDRERFSALCRNTLVTSEERRHSGGSFGIGKSVLWRFSRLSTVIFGSMVSGNAQGSYRLFGRTELPFHDARGKEFNGPGWLGLPESRGSGERSISVWDQDAFHIGSQLNISRSAEEDFGTSIAVLGFFEPDQEEQRCPDQIAQDILKSASRWFWPSLFLQIARPLRVSVAIEENGATVSVDSASVTDEVQPFLDAATTTGTKEILEKPNDVAAFPLTIQVPGRRPTENRAGSSNQDATYKLVLRYSSAVETKRSNTVALVRGAGMVVKYHSPKRPLGDQAYHGVLWAGLINGENPADQALEEFLRAAEPPSHNDWTHKTDRVRESYKPGAKARLDELWNNIDRCVLKAFQSAQPDTEEGPRKLAALFPLQGASGGKTGRDQFRVSQGEAVFEDDSWSFSGKVKRVTKSTSPWEILILPQLDVESGERTPLNAIQLEADNAKVTSLENGWKCVVDANVDDLAYEGLADASETGVGSEDLGRTVLVLDVRARTAENSS